MEAKYATVFLNFATVFLIFTTVKNMRNCELRNCVFYDPRFFQLWPKLCKAGGARVFDQMTSNQVPVGPEYILNHLRAHERNLFN